MGLDRRDSVTVQGILEWYPALFLSPVTMSKSIFLAVNSLVND